VIQELFHKAGVRTRSQLVRIAIENTLLTGLTAATGQGEAPRHQDDLALAGVTPEPSDGLEGLRRYIPTRHKAGKRGIVHVENAPQVLFV
jgi:hypothetical protein